MALQLERKVAPASTTLSDSSFLIVSSFSGTSDAGVRDSIHRKAHDVRFRWREGKGGRILNHANKGTQVGAEAAIAVMRHRERQVRDAFQRAGAIDPGTARSLDEIGVDESMAFRRLHRQAIVRESSPGCFYFDEETWDAVRATRLRLGLMVVIAVVITVLVGLYATSAAR